MKINYFVLIYFSLIVFVCQIVTPFLEDFLDYIWRFKYNWNNSIILTYGNYLTQRTTFPMAAFNNSTAFSWCPFSPSTFTPFTEISWSPLRRTPCRSEIIYWNMIKFVLIFKCSNLPLRLEWFEKYKSVNSALFHPLHWILTLLLFLAIRLFLDENDLNRNFVLDFKWTLIKQI